MLDGFNDLTVLPCGKIKDSVVRCCGAVHGFMESSCPLGSQASAGVTAGAHCSCNRVSLFAKDVQNIFLQFRVVLERFASNIEERESRRGWRQVECLARSFEDLGILFYGEVQ